MGKRKAASTIDTAAPVVAEPRVPAETLIGSNEPAAAPAGPGPLDELADRGAPPGEPLPRADSEAEYDFDDSTDELDAVLPHEEKVEGGPVEKEPAPQPAPEVAAQVEPGAEEEPVPEHPSIDARLLAQAEVMGFSQEELDKFPTEESLASALELVGRKILGPAQQPGGQLQPQPQRPVQQAPPQPQQAEAPPEGLDEKLAIDLNEEEFGPEVVGAFKQLNDHYHGQVQDLRKVIMGLCTYLDGRDAMAAEEQFDDWIGTLDGYDGIFGKGSILELEPQGEPVTNRHKVFTQMGRIGAIYRQRGERVPPPKRLRELALRFEFGDHQATAIRREISQKLTQQAKGAIGRPAATAPAGPMPTGDGAAVAFARNFFRDRGIKPGTADPDVENDGI